MTTFRNLLLALLASATVSASAAEAAMSPDTTATTGTKVAKSFRIMPTGRAMFDAAAYTPEGDGFKAGVALAEARLGAKADFGDFEARVDISYKFGKFSPADIFLQWNIDANSFLKGGYFIHQFGLQSGTGAAAKISMEEPIAQSALGESRMPGAMYVWHNPKLHFAGSLFAQSSAFTKHADELGRTGFGAMARFAWHPVAETGNIFQIGISALMQTATFDGDTKNPVSTFKANFPTRVCDTRCLSAEVDHVKSIFKASPEVLWAKGRVAAEGQYYFMNAARRDGLPSFKGMGAYVLARVLLNRHAAYSYSAAPACIATPASGTWEIVGGFSWADLNDDHASIYGGNASNFSLTLNYYIHKYITWRVNYSYTSRGEAGSLPARHLNIFQTRIQFLF